jgi:hypothetical protein
MADNDRRNSFTNLTWTPDIETILNNIRMNCLRLTEYHRGRYFRLTGFIKWFRLPVIVLSAINSVFGVMMTQFASQQAVTVFTSIISLVVGVIGSIELFLGVQDKLTKELSSSKDHYSLSTILFKMLSLKKENRHVEALGFLDDHFSQYSKLIHESNIKDEMIYDYLLPVESPVQIQVHQPTEVPCHGVQI